MTLGIPSFMVDTVGTWLMHARGRNRLPVVTAAKAELWDTSVTDFSASKELMFSPFVHLMKTLYLTEDVGEGWRTGSSWLLSTTEGERDGEGRVVVTETLSMTRFAEFDLDGRVVCIQTQHRADDDLLHFVKVEEVDGCHNRQAVGTLDTNTGVVRSSFPRIMHKACPFCEARKSTCECPPDMTEPFLQTKFMSRRLKYRENAVSDLRARILYNREWMNGMWHGRVNGNTELSVWNLPTVDHSDGVLINTLTRILQHETEQLLKPSPGLRSRQDHHLNFTVSLSPAQLMEEKDDLTTTAVFAVEEKATYRCSICNISIKRKYDVQRHIRSVHERRRDYRCPECPQAFLRSSHLKDHMRGAHAETTENMCPLCGRHFGMSSKLKRHIASVHQNLRSFECQHCEKRYKDNKALKAHALRKHSVVL